MQASAIETAAQLCDIVSDPMSDSSTDTFQSYLQQIRDGVLPATAHHLLAKRYLLICER